MHEIDLSQIDLNLLVTLDVLMREGSVTRAAKRLGRTQSAVSHSLARLRTQLGDPLFVKSGGRMMPSPHALKIAEDLQPILRNIQRIISAPEPFDPQKSERLFRIAAPDMSQAVMSGIISRVSEEAPGASVEWLLSSQEAYGAVAAGLIDIAEMAGSAPLPEELEAADGEPYTRMTFARKGHPAAKNWGVEAWTKWPHIKVKLGNAIVSAVDQVATDGGPQRKIGAWIPSLFSVAPLLASSDLLATFPPLVMIDAVKPFNLCVLEPPVPIPPMPVRFLWCRRMTNDPGGAWFRKIVIEVFTKEQKRAEAAIARYPIVRPKTGRRR
jgi:DNA-binding transcriptional LysR family regulator